jgi:hypothetical protein
MQTRAMTANHHLRRLPDDILELICAKMPRLADVHPILLERLRTGSWDLMKNG